MAKVHKAHKSTQKYSFQRNKKRTIGIVVAVVVLIAALAIGIVAYNNSTSGEIAVTAPTHESLNNIAANWQILAADTSNFYNYYSYNEDGTDGAGSTMMYYFGNEHADSVQIYVNTAELLENTTDAAGAGVFTRTSLFDADLGSLFSGEIDLSAATVELQVANDNCYIYIIDYDAETLDDSVVHEIIAELEAIIAAAPPAIENDADAETTEVTETTESTDEAAE